MIRLTKFSPCRKYRYTLWRDWFEDIFDHGAYAAPLPPYVMFIGLNPSTADETLDDPTIRRCKDFAKRWGFSALCMTNLFAFRATDPKAMKREPNPIGLDNQHHLLSTASEAALVVCAWGKDGKHMHQDLTVRQWLKGVDVKLHHLGLNGDGTPKHPLYLSATLKPVPWKV